MKRPPTLAGVVLVAVGSVLLLDVLEVIDLVVDARYVVPILLLAAGVWLLVRRAPARPAPEVPVWFETPHEASDVPIPADRWQVTTVFADRRVRLPEGTFHSGTVVTVFGDVDVDLTAATVAEPARIGGSTIFGDVDVFVPADWDVRTAGTTVFGDVRVAPAQPTGAPAPVLTLDLVTIFGDVSVRRVPVPATVAG